MDSSVVHPSKQNNYINFKLKSAGFTEKSSQQSIHSSSLNSSKLPYSHEPQKNGGDNLYIKIRGLLIVGKFLGVIPCSGVFMKNLDHFKFRWASVGSLLSLLVVIMLGMNSVVSFIGMCKSAKQNAADLAFAGSGWLFYTVGTYIYIYFLRYAKEFTNLFTDWNKLQMYFKTEDKTLSRDVGIVAGILFTSAVFENALLQITQFPFFENGATSNSTDSFFHTYYTRADPNWSKNVPYHICWSIFIFISNKFALYSWNFVDGLIAVFSRALYVKFKLLHEAADEIIPTITQITNNNPSFTSLDSQGHPEHGLVWTYLVRDHTTLCNLLEKFESFMSPIVFCSYGANIFYTCLQLLLGLTPTKEESGNPDHINSRIYGVYATWSFVHLIARLYLVSLFSANINVHAHLISRCLRRCPVIYYNTEVQRTDRRVCTGPEIGLTGLGAFTVTKPFILSIIGVVFTFEIVLLQSSTQPTCPPIPPNCILPKT